MLNLWFLFFFNWHSYSKKLLHWWKFGWRLRLTRARRGAHGSILNRRIIWYWSFFSCLQDEVYPPSGAAGSSKPPRKVPRYIDTGLRIVRQSSVLAGILGVLFRNIFMKIIVMPVFPSSPDLGLFRRIFLRWVRIDWNSAFFIYIIFLVGRGGGISPLLYVSDGKVELVVCVGREGWVSDEVGQRDAHHLIFRMDSNFWLDGVVNPKSRGENLVSNTI